LQQEDLPENFTKTRTGCLVVPCGETKQIFAVDCYFADRLKTESICKWINKASFIVNYLN